MTCVGPVMFNNSFAKAHADFHCDSCMTINISVVAKIYMNSNYIKMKLTNVVIEVVPKTSNCGLDNELL